MRTTLFPDKKQKSVTARFGRGFENAEREIGETGRRDARVAGRRRRVRRTHHAGGVDGGLQLLHGEGHEGLRATLAALLREMRGDRRRVCECPESLKPATRAFEPSRVPSRGLTGENARVARARRAVSVGRYRSGGKRERAGSSPPLEVRRGRETRRLERLSSVRTAPPAAQSAPAVAPQAGVGRKPPCPAN